MDGKGRATQRLPFDPSQMRAARRRDGKSLLTVSQLTRQVRHVLQTQFPELWVVGEVSNVSAPTSGHIYFTLKDESAQIAAVAWRGDAARNRGRIVDGLRVIVGGSLAVYEKRGPYQIVVRHVEVAGAGALELALRELVARLESEGLFAPEHKKPLPGFPEHLAVVTSSTGAAVRDILHVIDGRFPRLHVTVFPVKVQGEGAAEEIASAIELVNRLGGYDVVIVGRGGGSLEELWPFNEERVARAIFASVTPVVSGVGHEIDTTVSDLVADARAPTPTAAAQMVVPDEREVAEHLGRLARRLADILRSRLTTTEARMTGLERAVSPALLEGCLREREMRLDDAVSTAGRAARMNVEMTGARLSALRGRLRALDPRAVLSRGYSITRRVAEGAVLRDREQVAPGDDVLTVLARGRFVSKVIDETQGEGTGCRGEKGI